MSRLKRHIAIRFLFLAIGIILSVHQVVPHHHHDEVTEEEHISEHASAHTFWEYLQLAFHQELGNDDLVTSTTTVEKASSIATYYCLPILFSFTSEITSENLVTAFYTSSEIQYNTHFYLLSNQFRAPPLA